MINRLMEIYILQEKVKEESATGAEKVKWKDVKEISVAVYKNSDSISIQSIRHNISTHTGLTSDKNVRAEINRIIRNGIVYNVTNANSNARLNTLLLKVVDTDV